MFHANFGEVTILHSNMLEYTTEPYAVVLAKQPPTDLTWNCLFVVMKFSLNPVDNENTTCMSYWSVCIYIG